MDIPLVVTTGGGWIGGVGRRAAIMLIVAAFILSQLDCTWKKYIYFINIATNSGEM